MRYRELCEARPWKTYKGQSRPCLLASPEPLGAADCVIIEAEGQWGTASTGKTEVFWGFFVRIIGPAGAEWLGEDRHSIRAALHQACEAAEHAGWSALAIGLSSDWRETGLSSNSGYGYHPAHPYRAVHMLEPSPREH